MGSKLNDIILECQQDLLLLRDYVEMTWNGADKDWAEDKVNEAIDKIRMLLMEEE